MTLRNHMPKMLLEFLPSSPLEGYDITTVADGGLMRRCNVTRTNAQNKIYMTY